MHKILLFSLLLFGMLPYNSQAQSLPLNQDDAAGLAILKQHNFLPDTFPILSSLDGTQAAAYRTAGVPVDSINGIWRVTQITLANNRVSNIDTLLLINGRPPRLHLDSIAPAFRGDRLSYVGKMDIGINELEGSFNTDWAIDSLWHFTIEYDHLTNIDNLILLNSSHLRELRVYHNKITTLPQELFTSCPNIEVIAVDNNPVAALPPPNVINGSIDLAGSGTTISDISYYSGLSNLQILTINDMDLTGTFHIEHFLGAQLALPSQDRPLKELILHHSSIDSNHFDNISDRIAQEAFAAQEPSSLMLSYLSFPQLTNATGLIKVENNGFDFEDLHNLMISIGFHSAGIASFITYMPQDSLGIGGTRRRGVNMPLNFQLEQNEIVFVERNNNTLSDRLGTTGFGIRRNNYTWYWGNATNSAAVVGGYDIASGVGTMTVPALSGQYLELRDSAAAVQRPTLAMISDSFLTESFVFSEVTNDNFPLLTLHSKYKTIIVGDCLDTLGQIIQCQELSVQFDDTTSAAVRQLRRAEFGATVIESCVCGKIELWALPDTFQRVSMEANGAGTRIASTQASTKPGLKSADPNYPLLRTNGGIVDTTPTMANVQGNRNTSRTLIAVIDSGSDPDHPLLSANLRANANETPNDGSDNDGNCITDDVFGYNFLDRNNIAYDDHGHGTTVAGILAGYGSPSLEATDTSIAILPIKYTNRLSQGTSYEAACAIYYAADYHVNNNDSSRNADSVRVINASWGYQGEYCQILHDAIDYAGKNCGVLFVCSAGNESADNNQVPHYPSNFELDNILAVAASESNGNSLSTYSNYGATTVDIAAPGTYTNTLIPQVGISPNTSALATSGTSFAAPYVSRAAGILFNRYPGASYESVKRALMATATPINGADSAKIYSRGIVNLPAALAYLDTMAVRNVCSHVVAVGTDITYLGEQAKAQTVFPNPVSNAVQIIFAVAPENDVQIQVLDLKGTVILQQTMQGQALLEVSMQNVPQGFYILQVRDGSTLTSHKIVKM
jgi:hypothetical protein